MLYYRAFAPWILLSAIVSICAPVRSESVNLIKNPGFEQKGEGWLLPGSGFEVDSKVAHSGASSLRMSWTDPNKPSSAYQSFPVKPGRRYVIQAWMKSDSIDGAWFAKAFFSIEWAGKKGFDWNDTKEGVLGSCKPDGIHGVTDWTQITFATPPAPSNAEQGRMAVSIDWSAYGTAWIDDLSVREAETAEIIDWRIEPDRVVGDKDTAPFVVSIAKFDPSIFPEPVDVSVTLCAPTWNKHLVEKREEYKPGLSFSFPTADLNHGLWRFSTVVKGRKSGRALMEPEIRTLAKRQPIECFLDPHAAVVQPDDPYPSVDLRAYRDGTVTCRVLDSSGGEAAPARSRKVAPGQDVHIALSDREPVPGRYTVRVTLSGEGQPDYATSLGFTVLKRGEADGGVIVGNDGILRDHGRPWFPIFMLDDTALENGAYYDGLKHLDDRNPQRVTDALDRLAGTSMGIMDWALPLGGVDKVVEFADECAKREIRLGLCLRDLYPNELGGWGGFPARAKFFPGMSPEQIVRTLVKRMKSHRALAFYYINDEMGTEYIELLKQMRNWVKEGDPLHPTVTSHFDFEPIRELMPGTDIVAPELYAWRSFDEPSAMAGMADKVNKAKPNSAPMWGNLVLLPDSYEASWDRFRAGAYIAIAKGARGLIIDGLPRLTAPDKPIGLWDSVVSLAKEIQGRCPILLQPASPAQCRTVTPDVVLRTVTGPKGAWLLAVNGARRAVRADIEAASGISDMQEGDRTVRISEGRLSLRMQPYEVKLVRLKAGFAEH